MKMNNAVHCEKLIKNGIKSGADDISITAQLISTGLKPSDATKLLNSVKKDISKPVESLPGTWMKWIKENLDRNCNHGDLANILNNELGLPVENGHKIIEDVLNNDVQFNAEEHDAAFIYETPISQIDGNVINIDGHLVNVLMRHNKPPIILFDNVLTDAECDEIIQLSISKCKKSTVVDGDTGAETYNQYRNSSSAFFKTSENDLIQKIEKRVAVLMNRPVENGEGFQVLNYQLGGEYRPHFDFFDPSLKGSKRHLVNGGQRISTMVIYLNNVESGGETSFPEVGIITNPKKGSAVYFEYTNSKGQVDKNSLHAGCPVIEGEKWILTKWVRERKFG